MLTGAPRAHRVAAVGNTIKTHLAVHVTAHRNTGTRQAIVIYKNVAFWTRKDVRKHFVCISQLVVDLLRHGCTAWNAVYCAQGGVKGVVRVRKL